MLEKRGGRESISGRREEGRREDEGGRLPAVMLSWDCITGTTTT